MELFKDSYILQGFNTYKGIIVMLTSKKGKKLKLKLSCNTYKGIIVISNGLEKCSIGASCNTYKGIIVMQFNKVLKDRLEKAAIPIKE